MSFACGIKAAPSANKSWLLTPKPVHAYLCVQTSSIDPPLNHKSGDIISNTTPGEKKRECIKAATLGFALKLNCSPGELGAHVCTSEHWRKGQQERYRGREREFRTFNTFQQFHTSAGSPKKSLKGLLEDHRR